MEQGWKSKGNNGEARGRRISLSAQDRNQAEMLHTIPSTSSSSPSDEYPTTAKQNPCTEISRTPSASTTHTQYSVLESSGCESQDSNGEGTVPSSVASSASRDHKDEDEETQLDHSSSPSERSEKSRGKMRKLDLEDPGELGLEVEEITILGSSREGSGSTSTPVKVEKLEFEGGVQHGSPFSSRPTSPSPLSPRSNGCSSGLTSPRSMSTPAAQSSREQLNKPKTNRNVTLPNSSTSTNTSSSTSDPIQAQRKLRRLYALLELVDTEKSYAQDMNALVRVYFSQLNTMPFFSSGNSTSNSNSNHHKSNSNQNSDLSSSSSSIAIPTATSSNPALNPSPPLSSSSSASALGGGSPNKATPMTTTTSSSTSTWDNPSGNHSSPSSPSPTPAVVLPQEKHSLGLDRLRSVVRNAEELYQLTNRISAGLNAIVSEAGIAGEDLNKTSNVGLGADGKEKSEMEIKLEIAMSVNAEAAVHVIAEYFTTLVSLLIKRETNVCL